MNESLPSSIADALGTGLPVPPVAVRNLHRSAGRRRDDLYDGHAVSRRELLRQGNVAAATVLSGAVMALAIPLAALLATTRAVLDILVWGIVAILLNW